MILFLIVVLVLTGCSNGNGSTAGNQTKPEKTETRPEDVGLAKAEKKPTPDIIYDPDGPYPTEGPDPTQEITPSPTPEVSEETYNFYCLDLSTGDTIEGVTLQICDDETCRLFTSDAYGTVTFTGTSPAYEAVIYDCPGGYETAWEGQFVTAASEDVYHDYYLWLTAEESVITESLNTPDFTVYDMYGYKYNLSDYSGCPVIVNVWATWCGPCVSELPHFQRLYEEYGDKVEFLMVNCEEPDYRDDVYKFLDEYGYTFPVYFDDDWSVDNAYGTGYIPYTITIDCDGNMIRNEVGSQEEDVLRKFIEEIIH